MAAMKVLYHYEWNSCGQCPQPDISDVHVYSSWRIYGDSLQGRKVYQNSLSSEKCLHCLSRNEAQTWGIWSVSDNKEDWTHHWHHAQSNTIFLTEELMT